MSITERSNADEERMRFTLRDQESRIKELKEQLSKSAAEMAKHSVVSSRYQSDLQQSQVEQFRLTNEVRRQSEEIESMKNRLVESQFYDVERPSFASDSKRTQHESNEEKQFQSPDAREMSPNPNTPAARLKITSPQIPEVEVENSSSSGTHQKPKEGVVYRNLSLR